MKRTVLLPTAFLVPFVVSALSFAAPSPAHAGSSLAALIKSDVMSAVGVAKGAAVEAEMRELRVKAAMAAKARAAMEAQAVMANRSGAMQALPVACSAGSDGGWGGEQASLVDSDRCPQ
jgi:hypothetical protein